MRLCRILRENREMTGFYFGDEGVLPTQNAAHAIGIYEVPTHGLLELLPGGSLHHVTLRIQAGITPEILREHLIPINEVKLLTPVAAPGKILLLAGNYADHIEEGGGIAEDPSKTFPYLFMKPNSTLTHPGDPIRIPAESPDQIDWELELGVIIGKECRNAPTESALDYVAGYTVVNDISDRGFRPNPDRVNRPRDPFFDWQHGKWHDTFCPMGPCVLPGIECPDPQSLKMTLHVNDRLEQNSSTAKMIFPVREILNFVSRIVTLHPGDIICTGTPAGVGKAKGRFLNSGDRVLAQIEKIGQLESTVL